MEHNTQHNIISDSMIDAAENIRKVEIADAKAIVDIYNYYVENTAISFETEPLTVNEMAERIKEREGSIFEDARNNYLYR